jgi:hypothetical protein
MLEKQGQQFVSDHVPEVNDPVRTPAHESGAENDVGFSVQNWLEQARIFLGVVLEVGILNEDDFARGGAKPLRKAAPFPRLTP